MGRKHSDAHSTTITTTLSLPSNTNAPIISTGYIKEPFPPKPHHLHREEVLSGLLRALTTQMKVTIKKKKTSLKDVR